LIQSGVVETLDLGQRNPCVDATQGLNEALLRLLEVNDIPNRIEVLSRAHQRVCLAKGEWTETHIDLDIEVLEVEGVFPDVDTDDRGQVQERVLVSSGGNLQTLGGGVESLEAETNRYRSNLASSFIRQNSPASPSRNLG